jgi:predicted AlkP superfamily pyrophosphatase or phosphodiesterase
MQATFTTGAFPSEHGIVANGIFLRETQEVYFWHQSSKLLLKRRFWRDLPTRISVAMLFWQQSKFEDADFILTPSPLHLEEKTIPSCYSKPGGLYLELVEKFGEFPLHRYWGPLASHESSFWIASATRYVLERHNPDLTLTYIPHLDYSLQREGPDPASKGLSKDLSYLDQIISGFIEIGAKMDLGIIVLSEYTMLRTAGVIELNRALRKKGVLSIRRIGQREYLEPGDCNMFAVVDHQIAHVYLKDLTTEYALDVIRDIDPQIEVLIQARDKKRLGINNPRSGELVLIAPRDRWFAYPWWEKEESAPEFAKNVDIHRKPGYDPLELFFSDDQKGISGNMGLVKGSHGRMPEFEDEMGVFITNRRLGPVKTPLDAIKVSGILRELMGI